MQPTNLTDAIVKALQPGEKDRIVYEPGGLGVRVTPSGRKSFVVQARVGGQSRRFPIGPVSSDLNVKSARGRAAVIKADLAERRDPVAEQAKRLDVQRAERDRLHAEAEAEEQRKAAAGITLSAFWRTYQARAKGEVQPITLKTYGATFSRYIEPVFGATPVRKITRAAAWEMHGQLMKGFIPKRDGKALLWEPASESGSTSTGDAPEVRRQRTANKAVQILRLILSDAEDREIIPPNSNELRNMKLPIDRERSTFLNDAELKRVFEALDALEGHKVSATSAAFIRVMLLTGARASELQALRWEHVDAERLTAVLPRGKNGDARVIPLAGAWNILSTIPRSTGLVFWARGPNMPFVKYRDAWRIVRVKADVEHVKLHDLRHSFASVVLAQGHALPVIGSLLGHRSVASTKRYSHLATTAANEVAQEAATAIFAAVAGGRATAGLKKR